MKFNKPVIIPHYLCEQRNDFNKASLYLENKQIQPRAQQEYREGKAKQFDDADFINTFDVEQNIVNLRLWFIAGTLFEFTSKQTRSVKRSRLTNVGKETQYSIVRLPTAIMIIASDGTRSIRFYTPKNIWLDRDSPYHQSAVQSLQHHHWSSSHIVCSIGSASAFQDIIYMANGVDLKFIVFSSNTHTSITTESDLFQPSLD